MTTSTPSGVAAGVAPTSAQSPPASRSRCAAIELCRLDVADLRPNPHVVSWGTYGSVHVRYGKAVRGGIPRRRTVLAVPEFDDRADQPGLGGYFDARFAEIRDQLGLDPALSLHCLRHSYVTHLVEFGYPERFVQEQVGHAYASTTAIYTSVSNDFKNQALQTALRRV